MEGHAVRSEAPADAVGLTPGAARALLCAGVTCEPWQPGQPLRHRLPVQARLGQGYQFICESEILQRAKCLPTGLSSWNVDSYLKIAGGGGD